MARTGLGHTLTSSRAIVPLPAVRRDPDEYLHLAGPAQPDRQPFDRRGLRVLALDLVGVEVDVAANHVEGRVTQDPLEALAVEPGPPAEPAEGVLDRSRGERPPITGREEVIDVASDRPRAAVGEVLRQAGLGHGPEGNEERVR